MRSIHSLGGKECILCTTKEESKAIVELFNYNGFSKACKFGYYLELYGTSEILYTRTGFCYRGFYEEEGYKIINASEFLEPKNPKSPKFTWCKTNKIGAWAYAGNEFLPNDKVEIKNINFSDLDSEGWYYYIGEVPEPSDFDGPQYSEIRAKDLFDLVPKYFINENLKLKIYSITYVIDGLILVNYYKNGQIESIRFVKEDNIKVIF